MFVVKIFLPPLCTDGRDNKSIQQCLHSREQQPLHWMCPQLPPFLLGSKFPKRCERGGRDRSLKPGSVCGKFSCPKRKIGVLGWAVPSGMVGDPGTIPTLARQGGGQCWERTWGQQGSQMQLQGLLSGTTDGGADSSSLTQGRKCRPQSCPPPVWV